MGLIGLIPIVGSMVLYGWTLALVERLRGRWRELPPPGFEYLERGVAPFLVFLVYGFGALLVIGLFVGLAVVLGFAVHALIPLAVLIGLFAFVLLVGWWAVSLYCFGTVLLLSDRRGIEGALDPRVIWRTARANHRASVRVALTYLVCTLVVTAIALPIGFVVPFGGALVGVVLPAVFAAIGPALTGLEVN
ncbi:MAG TPA: DUF4013 domain-containing protein [Candidatus Dormibacteraeota bacterium]